MIVGKFIAIAVLGYLIGAIPFALVVARRMGGIDISKYGSGNIGGTNVLGTVGKKAGTIAVILDMGKGAAAVILAEAIIGDSVLPLGGFSLDWQFAQVVAGLMVMVGHNWSAYIKFRGGKGAAAYFGSWFAMAPAAALFGGAIIILTVLLTRYMSLGSMLAAAAIACWFIVHFVVYQAPVVYLAYSLVAGGLIVYQHRGNIGRLRSGTELRLGERRGRAE